MISLATRAPGITGLGYTFFLTMLRLGRERAQLRIVDEQVGVPRTSMALADATLGQRREDCGGAMRKADDGAGVYSMTCAGRIS